MKIHEFSPTTSKIFEKYSESQDLLEINMSPGNLRKLAAGIDALAGIEFEMILPNVNVDDSGDQEPNWDADESSNSFRDIREFFLDNDYNSTRDVERMLERLQEEYYEFLDEEIQQRWDDEAFDYMLSWAQMNVSDSDVAGLLELEADDEGDFDIGKSDYVKFVERCIEEQNSYYDDAQQEFRDDEYGSADESEWLGDNYSSMSDIANSFPITWPHYYTSGGDMDVDQVADEFGRMIGRPVNASSSYHGARREAGTYVVEPDSSLDPDDSSDGGLEFVSPPLPVDQMFSDMEKIATWAAKQGAYTNDSTGLHINISVNGFSPDRLDYVKLALLMGDEYVLEKFGRMSNTYTKSAMSVIRDRVSMNPADAQKLLQQMKDHLGEIATKLIHDGQTSKYTSINTKSGYIEFRSPGGDWLSDYANNRGKIEDTLLRFVVALDAAINPDKFRQEYLKKLYKLLAPKSETDALAYFAKFSAGELPQSALKSFIKQAQLERSRKKAAPTDEPSSNIGNWGIYMSAVNRFARQPGAPGENMPEYRFPSREAAEQWIAKMRAERPQMRSDIEVREFEPANSEPAATGGNEFTGNWLIKDSSGQVLHRFGGIGNSQSDANRVASQWIRSNPGTIVSGEIEVVPEMR
jgi:hypothetical protein